MNSTPTPTTPATIPDPLLDVADICAFLGLGERTLRRWISSRAFPPPDARLRGKLLRWRRSTLDAWVQSQAVPRK
ncbi:MAG: helix-turn-helix domain-containing protein [Phycisphaerales bacterium]|nr:helix-turn-helix domain-containing protein [Phycisphaerales bacterium]